MHKIPGSTLRSVFGANHRIQITSKMISDLEHWVTKYELYKEHPLALNSPYLGGHDIYFIRNVHQPPFFEIFGLDVVEFARSITTISTVDLSMTVRSDPLNLATTWLCHLICISSIPEKHKQSGYFNLLKVMHYKFFSSLIFYRFEHGANEDIMRAVIESLDKKSDIIVYGSWRKVIEARCMDMINLTHKLIKDPKIARSTYLTWHEYKDDDDTFYVISDAQTRLRDRINLFTTKFHELKEAKQIIGSYDSATTINGEKVLRDTSGALGNMSASIGSVILSSNQFIDSEYISFLCKLNSELKPYMLKTFLEFFSDLSVQQLKSRKLDDVKMIKGELTITGHRELIAAIIQTTYRNCINSGVNLKNKLDVLKSTGNIYRSSQIQDEDVFKIKRSVEYLIDLFPGTSRYNTKLALKINFILYILLLSFKYL